MPVLKTRVDLDTKIRFAGQAKRARLSESELLRVRVVDRLEPATEHAVPATSEPQESAAPDRMTVWLPAGLKEAVKTRARQRGMAPSRWMASLAQFNLTNVAALNEDEVSQLRTSNRELAAIGRNINQVARALNAPLQNKDRVPLRQLEQLAKAVEKNRAAIAGLIRGTKSAWQGD
jgi:predicted DNA binding CopG/RHH family protein